MQSRPTIIEGIIDQRDPPSTYDCELASFGVNSKVVDESRHLEAFALVPLLRVS